MTNAASPVMVPMEVEYPPSWLTWVASTTGCLRALGHPVDQADVAGFSGYAFVMTVHEELCHSGPTMFDWRKLPAGIEFLGRHAIAASRPKEHHCAKHKSHTSRLGCLRAFEAAAKEIRAGRPCVIWGTYAPEFGIVVGIENQSYHVRSFRSARNQPDPPIPFDQVDAPNGAYTLTFPRHSGRAAVTAGDGTILRTAMKTLPLKPWARMYHMGLDAYDAWIDSLEANRVRGFGNAYNAQCWSEAKTFARVFLSRMAYRNADNADLREALEAWQIVSAQMRALARLFPFSGERKEAEDAGTRAAGVEHLRAAKEAEARGRKALARAAKSLPK